MGDRGMLAGILGAGLVAGGALLWFLLSAGSEPPPSDAFEVRWWAYSYDPDALAGQLGGGHPEFADRFVELLPGTMPTTARRSAGSASAWPTAALATTASTRPTS